MTKMNPTPEQAARIAERAAVCDQEREARILVATARECREWDAGEQAVLAVFKAMWSACLPVCKIEEIGAPMLGYKSLDLAEPLARLARAGVLRTRLVNYGSLGRVRCYELKLS